MKMFLELVVETMVLRLELESYVALAYGFLETLETYVALAYGSLETCNPRGGSQG